MTSDRLSLSLTVIQMVGSLSGAILCSNPAFAQVSASLFGVIRDAETREPLPATNILVQGTHSGDVADDLGQYHLDFAQAGTCTLVITRVGYDSLVVTINLAEGEKRQRDFELRPRAVELRKVTVEATRLSQNYMTQASLVGLEYLSPRDLTTTPAAFDDVLRSVQIKNSITSSGDYSGYFSVRGGNANENQVVIDGVVVPNPYRFRAAFGGGFSDINPNTVENVTLHIGGYSAEFGDALSSVVEIESRAGNTERLSAQLSANLTDLNGLVEGPLPGIPGSFLVSLRRTYYDFVANRFIDGNSSFPFFSELAGKVHVNLNSRNTLTLSLTKSTEGTELQSDLSTELNVTDDGEKLFPTLVWRSVLGERWQARAILSYYRDKISFRAFKPDTSLTIQDKQTLSSEVENFSFKHHLRYHVSEGNWLTFGATAAMIPARVQFVSQDREFIYARTEFPLAVDFDDTYRTYAGYVESSNALREDVHVRLGGRYDYSTLIGAGNFSPRFALWHEIDERTHIHASWGIIYQYPNPAAIFDRDPAVDLSSNLDELVAEKATHTVVGFSREFTAGLSGKLELYYKDLNNLLIPIDEGTFVPQNTGSGNAHGLELQIEQKSSGDNRLSGFLSYAFNKSRYRDVTGGGWRRFKFDRRHSITAFADLKLWGNWRASLLWRAASGLPFTDVTGVRIVSETEWAYLRGQRNEANFPFFHRLDARLNYTYQSGAKAISFYLDFNNVTNQKNIYDIIWEKEVVVEGGDITQLARKRTFFMLPFVPSFGFNLRL